MRFSEKHEDNGVGMALADLNDLGGSVTIAGTNPAQILARHAVEAVDCLGVIARGYEQFVKRAPVISPVEGEADALPKLLLVNFSPPPFVEDVLIAGEDGLHSENYGTVADHRALLQQRRSMALCGRQGMVVTHEHHIG